MPMKPKQRRKSNPRGGPRPGMTEEDRYQETLMMLRMRRAGADYVAIANHFGVSRETAYRKVRDALADIPREEASNLRALESAKLDHAELKLQASIEAGDVPAINALVRISESRRRLLGLDMPEQHEVKITREEETLIDQLAQALTERNRREDTENGTDAEWT